MSILRPPCQIQADIAGTALRLEELRAERTRSRRERRAGIVLDFDAGMARPSIAAKWGVDYGAVAAVLHKAGRTERTRRARDLTPAQRAHYDRLVGQPHISSRLACSIARAVAPEAAPEVVP